MRPDERHHLRGDAVARGEPPGETERDAVGLANEEILQRLVAFADHFFNHRQRIGEEFLRARRLRRQRLSQRQHFWLDALARLDRDDAAARIRLLPGLLDEVPEIAAHAVALKLAGGARPGFPR